MDALAWVRRRPFWVWAIALALVGVAVGILFIQNRCGSRFRTVRARTNLIGTSFLVTHGTNHVFYYPNRFQWELSNWRTRLGLGTDTKCQRLVCHTLKPVDTVWLVCRYRGSPADPASFRAVEVRTGERKHIYRSTGGIFDTTRSVSVFCWSFAGGLDAHKGSTIHVEDSQRLGELVSLQLR